MSAATDSIDLAFDLREVRRLRARRFMRVAVPIVTLVILLVSIAGIGAYLYQTNRADARVLTDDLLKELERRIVAEVIAYLRPASEMVRLAEQALGNESIFGGYERLVEPLSAHMLESNSQLATISFADPEGNFLMVTKAPDGSVHTKFVDRRGPGVETTWVRRDADGNVVAREQDPADTFDPRSRPWYQGAADTDDLYWSDVYVFFTSRKPGITASLPVLDRNGDLAAVYAVDIALEDLSAFLASLEIGIQGRALIVDADGVLVAYPDLDRMLKDTDEGVARAHVEELADPVLNRAFDHFRVDGPGTREFNVRGRRYISTAASLAPTLGRDWTLLIVAPEDDFVGFVASNNRRGLYMSVAVLTIASILAGLLVVQGLRADRNALLAQQRTEQIAAQSRAFSGLAAEAALFDPDDEDAVSTLTETVASVALARRVSVWRLSADGRRLVCEDAFDKETMGHTGGIAFGEDQLPQYFQCLAAGEELVAVDAASDPRTAELHRIYLHPLGCRVLSAIPVMRDSEVLGALWLEDNDSGRDGHAGDIEFGRAVANLLALRMHRTGNRVATNGGDRATEHRGDESGGISDAMRETALLADSRAEALRARLASEQGEGRATPADVYEDVSVAVIRFTDPVSLAASVGGSGSNAFEELVLRLEALATEAGAEYLKMLGSQIVCAAGLDCGAREGAHAVGAFAVDALDGCARLFTSLEQSMAFRIGVDTGPVIGSAVGRGRTIFNLWGEAVVTAARMADTGVEGQIQVTETTYRQLREDYVFRSRGSFYLEDVGEMTTYFLTGRL